MVKPLITAALDFEVPLKKTKGRVEVQIFASQLGGEDSAFQDVQQGVIQIASWLPIMPPCSPLPSMSSISPICSRTNQEGWDILDRSTGTGSTPKPSGKRQPHHRLARPRLPPRLQQQAPHPYHQRPRGPQNPRAQQPVIISPRSGPGAVNRPLAWVEPSTPSSRRSSRRPRKSSYVVFCVNKFEVRNYAAELRYRLKSSSWSSTTRSSKSNPPTSAGHPRRRTPRHQHNQENDHGYRP